MSEYIYSKLSQPTSIRLLRLLPSKSDLENLSCELFEYDLQNAARPYLPYEALSYVWGGESGAFSILLDNRSLNITRNLHTMLSHLRARDWVRIIWVDAICINQADEKEKERQIPFMAEIYARARYVLIWLGEAEDDGDEALEAICLAGEIPERDSLPAETLSRMETSSEKIIKLLRRPWFQRIWVLQEVAAARNISIVCGSVEVDGYAFCLGLDSLNTVLKESMTQVAFLIRGAIFRSRNMPRDHIRQSLNIYSLGELVDRYHAYKATRLHDKVYALLGMCSDDLEGSGLEPNYGLEWKELMRRLVRFILGSQISIETWNDTEMAIIKGKIHVLGKVLEVETGAVLDGELRVKVISYFLSKQPRFIVDDNTRRNDSDDSQTDYLILPKSAMSIQEGDIICLVQGASKPTIVRLHDKYFEIIMIAAAWPKHPETAGKNVLNPELPRSISLTREVLLFWTWELPIQGQGEYTNLLHKINRESSGKTNSIAQLKNLIQTWDVGHLLEDAGEDQKARTMFQEAAKCYGTIFRKDQVDAPEMQNGMTLLAWAAARGDKDVIELLLAGRGEVELDVNMRDMQGRTPLSHAAGYGQEAIVKLLLDTSKIEVDSNDRNVWTPLTWAAKNGHEDIVKVLLGTGKVDTDLKDRDGWTPLTWAARNGHEAVVKVLLDTGEVEVDLENRDLSGRVDDKYGWTPLMWAASNGQEAVVKLLLDTGKVEVDLKTKFGYTPLLCAASNGYEAIVKMLLDTGKIELDLTDIFGRTMLLHIAENGHDAIVKLLRSFARSNYT